MDGWMDGRFIQFHLPLLSSSGPLASMKEAIDIIIFVPFENTALLD